ncbi:hypothetical protein CIG75_12585 [Tumebacillus algifaecis]|uniref:Glycosyl transferase family 1 domain-containing protein n=1 Tax=Tumebacillus algifaecis TaxID=1214604 RepID=A0A223D2Y2_9BACL|nr:glycosyltransferase family 4 protein [Tumebacillus algifaecis]ASS75737.1 hypothetical protein CIG75_12585 [Tumebacillus algifaecis]
MTISCIAPGNFPFPPAACTSVEIYLWHLATQLARTEPVLLYGVGESPAQPNAPIQLTTRTFPAIDSKSYRHFLRKDLKQTPTPDLFHIENSIPLLLHIKKIKPRIPLLLNLHSNVLIQNFSAITIRHVFHRVDALVVNSEFLKNDLLDRYPFLQPAKVNVIHPGVDLQQFPSRFSTEGAARRAELRARYHISNDQNIVLTIGRFIPRKGIVQVIDAFRSVLKTHPNSELWIIGGHPHANNNAFHAQVRDKISGLPVRFFGFLPQSSLSDFYVAADLFVCASQLPEAFGLVNLEASAAGIPVLASAKWGLCESVAQNVSGRLVEAYTDPCAIAEEINALLSNKELCQQYGANGRRRVEEQFSWPKTSQAFRSLYSRIMT